MSAGAAAKPKVVVLGMMTKMPVAGVVWQTMHYVLGFERLGYETYYVETHAGTPAMLMRNEDDDSSLIAANFIARTMRRFDLNDRWAFRALHREGHCYGMSERQLARLIGSANVVLNLHGGTEPLPELAATGRLVYVETDPVLLQLELHGGRQETIDFLEPHCAFFTFGENLGNPDSSLPPVADYEFHPTRQPVVLDLWSDVVVRPGSAFTSIGNWKQAWRDVHFKGDTYTWSKHHEFLKFIELPRRSGREFELALASLEAEDRALLESRGWRVRDALEFSWDVDAYRAYIAASRGEFTVAKDQNVRFRTGWFSDRGATYLAAGRPVINQDTGFTNTLPTGAGLFGFTGMDEVLAALEAIDRDYAGQCAAARELARECFAHDVVLPALLAQVGADSARPQAAAAAERPLPGEMLLTAESRRPLVLPHSTLETAFNRPVPVARDVEPVGAGGASIVIVTCEGLVFTRLCIESLIANTAGLPYEIIVVDNGSRDDTPEYLATLSERNPHVRVLLNGSNLGFARACNEGLALARGDRYVLLNNDTMVPPNWLPSLTAHLADPAAGLVGPVTNRIGNESEIEADYETWSEFLAFAARRGREHRGESIEIPAAAMFCLAMRRDTYERLGPLDERYEVGLLEDDDYCECAHRAGYSVLCAEDVVVHHFGEASFGSLVPTGEYATILQENKRRYAEKWGREWIPYERRQSVRYGRLTRSIHELADRHLPDDARVLVVSRGDEALLAFERQVGLHFPQAEGGVYAGHYPGDSAEAIRHLESLRHTQGARYLLIPDTARWWLDHYAGLRRHLDAHYPLVVDEADVGTIYDLVGSPIEPVPAPDQVKAPS